MEIFDEVKNRYFHILFTVLNEAKGGISKEDIFKIIESEGFEEKIIGKDFQTFEGLLLNEYDEKENFNFLHKEDEMYYPNLKGNSKTSIPARFTNIEKAWLKNLIDEPNLKMLLKESTIIKLK